MSKLKYKILLVLFAISFIASAILAFVPTEQACGGVQTTCYAVQTSGYEQTFGVRNSNLGLIVFPILALLTLSHINEPKKYKKQILILGLIFGSIFSVYFLYLQFFVLHALCKYCLMIDGATLISLGVVLFWKEK